MGSPSSTWRGQGHGLCLCIHLELWQEFFGIVKWVSRHAIYCSLIPACSVQIRWWPISFRPYGSCMTATDTASNGYNLLHKHLSACWHAFFLSVCELFVPFKASGEENRNVHLRFCTLDMSKVKNLLEWASCLIAVIFKSGSICQISLQKRQAV